MRMFMLSICMGVSGVAYAANTVMLDKIFHHRSGSTPSIELGSIVFYFSQAPTIKASQKVAGQDSDTMEYHVMFPLTEATSKNVQQMITDFNQLPENARYQARINVVQEPNKALELVITYNRNNVEIAYDSFESIGLKKGIIVRVYNKDFLEQLKKHNRPIMRTVSRTVVIDCGHGGGDNGAIGFEGAKEKEVTLEVGLKVAQLLRRQGFTVHLTRSHDHEKVALDERTFKANMCKDAQAFVSLHANYSANQQASGIETFYLNRKAFKPLSTKRGQELVLTPAYALQEQSNRLAQAIHDTTLLYAQKKNPYAANRNVKDAVTQVLVGTVMPSALIEVGFLSHPYEGKLLTTTEYQLLLAKGISSGIISFLKGQTANV